MRRRNGQPIVKTNQGEFFNGKPAVAEGIDFFGGASHTSRHESGREAGAITGNAFWMGDWRLGIAEERVAMAEERLARAEEALARLIEQEATIKASATED